MARQYGIESVFFTPFRGGVLEYGATRQQLPAALSRAFSAECKPGSTATGSTRTGSTASTTTDAFSTPRHAAAPPA